MVFLTRKDRDENWPPLLYEQLPFLEKINTNIFKTEECTICKTQVDEKLKQRCFDFFGHIHKETRTCTKKHISSAMTAT